MNHRWTRKRAPLRLGWLRELVRAIFTTTLVFAALWGACEFYWRWTTPEQVAAGSIAPTADALRQLHTNRQLDRIDAAIQVYRLRHGIWPDSIQTVVAEGLLSTETLSEPGFVRSYYYRPAGTSYVLLPPAY